MSTPAWSKKDGMLIGIVLLLSGGGVGLQRLVAPEADAAPAAPPAELEALRARVAVVEGAVAAVPVLQHQVKQLEPLVVRVAELVAEVRVLAALQRRGPGGPAAEPPPASPPARPEQRPDVEEVLRDVEELLRELRRERQAAPNPKPDVARP